MSNDTYNHLSAQIYERYSTTPVKFGDDIQGIVFTTCYPGGLYVDASMFVPVDSITGGWAISGGMRVVISDMDLVVWEGAVYNVNRVSDGTSARIEIAARGAWADIGMVRQYLHMWADNRLSQTIWVEQTNAEIENKFQTDRLGVIAVTPKETDFISGDYIAHRYTCAGTDTISIVEYGFNLNVAAGQSWEMLIWDVVAGAAAAGSSVTATSTGTHTLTLATPRAAIELRYYSRAAQSPVLDDANFAEWSALTVYTSTDAVTPTQVCKDIITAITDINSETLEIDTNALVISPFISQGFEPVADIMTRASDYGDASGNPWAVYMGSSDLAHAPNGKPVLVYEQYPALTSAEYRVSLNSTNLLGGLALTENYEEIYNYVIPCWTDENGVLRYITPVEDANLTDAVSVANYGTRPIVVQAGSSDATAAVNVGYRYLAYHKAVRWSLTSPIVVTGYIEDSRGASIPASHIKAGERILITDFPQSPENWASVTAGLIFLISSTSYDDSAQTCSITTGSYLQIGSMNNVGGGSGAGYGVRSSSSTPNGGGVGANGWREFAEPGLGGSILPGGGAGGITGSGIVPRIAEWTGSSAIGSSTLIKTGAGVLTMVAGGAYSFTVPATGTAALLQVANTYTVGPQTINTGADANIGLIVKGNSATQSANLQEWQSSAGSVRAAISNGGFMGLGTTPITTARLYSYWDSNTNNSYGIYSDFLLGSSGDGTLTGYALNFRCRSSTSQTFLGGISGQIAYAGAGKTLATSAVYSGSYLNTNGTITDARGLDLQTSNSGGTIVSLYGVYVRAPVLTGGAAITNHYGVYVGNISSAGTLNYAVYTGLGLNRFGDQVDVIGSADRVQLRATGYTTQGSPVAHFVDNQTTADAAREVLRLEARVSTAATGSSAGFGPQMLFVGESATNASYQTMGKLSAIWSTATDATRTSYLSFGITNSAADLEIARMLPAGVLSYGNVEATTNLVIPATSSTAGQLLQGAAPILHTYTPGSATPLNIFVGPACGNFTMTHGSGSEGWYNYGSGQSVMDTLTTGYENTAIGTNINVTSGYYNTMLGRACGAVLTSGFGNTLLGYGAGQSVTEGYRNTCIGMNSGASIATADLNTMLGWFAGGSVTGEGNVMMGYMAGYAETGSNTLYIANTQTALPLVYGSFASNGRLQVNVPTTTVDAAREVLRIQANVSTAATGSSAGFGPALTFYGESATDTSYRQMGQIEHVWYTATDATRMATVNHYVYDTAQRKFLSATADGTGPVASLFGAVNLAVVTKTTTYTAAYEQVIECDASGGAWTLTLPSVSGQSGRWYMVKKTDSSANAVTIDAAGAELIDGNLTASLASYNDAIILVSDGTGWKIH